LLKFIYDDKIIELFADSTFANIDAAREFAGVPTNLNGQMAFYLVKDIKLEEIQKFPDKNTMSDEHKKIIENAENEANAEFMALGFDQENPLLSLMDMDKKKKNEIITMTFKSAMKIQAMTYLLGYKSK